MNKLMKSIYKFKAPIITNLLAVAVPNSIPAPMFFNF